MKSKMNLDKLFAQSKLIVDRMSDSERDVMIKEQAKSYVRAEASWPKPLYRWIDGVKVYDSYEDYCND